MTKILLKDGYVVTVDGKRTVCSGGFVAIDGSNIASVGSSSESPAEHGFDEVIDISGCIAMPGLINGHQHHWYTLFKGRRRLSSGRLGD